MAINKAIEEMKFTGERLVTSGDIHYRNFEHLHRYALAQEYVKGKVILDIASGEGYGTYLLSQVAKMAYGVDISEEAVIHAQKKYKNNNNIEYQLGSVTNIPFEDNKFDAVVSFETIEHLAEQELMLSEIKRVLKDDGILILSSPDREIYASRAGNNIYHIKELTLKELLELIKPRFKYTYIFKQLITIGSLVIPIEDEISKFKTYDGNYYEIKNRLQEQEFFNKPFFNILICSNVEIDKSKYAISSLFSCYESYENEKNAIYQELNILRSKLNRIESLLIVRLLKKIKRLLK
jgi:ubiquinone/menaquinone biosynthesis C-methylase UbiE